MAIHRAVWQGCGGAGVVGGRFVIRVHKNVKKPCKPAFTGLVVVASHRVLT